MKKKLLSTILAVAMLLTLLPTVALAAVDTTNTNGFSAVPVERLNTELVNGVTAEKEAGKVTFATSIPEDTSGWNQSSGAGSVDTYTYCGVYITMPDGAKSLKSTVDAGGFTYTFTDGDKHNEGNAFLQGGKYQCWFPIANDAGGGNYSLFNGGREYVVLLEWYSSTDCSGDALSKEYVIVTRNLQSPAASIGTTQYATLAAAIAAAADGNTVTLLDDVVLTNTLVINGGKTLVIDLNQHTISKNYGVITVQNANVTFTGTGTIKETAPNLQAVAVKGSNNESDTNYTTVTIGEDVTLEGWAPIFITPYQSSGAPYAYGVTVNVYGTLHGLTDTSDGTGAGIYVNGLIKHKTNYPVINIYPSANISSTGSVYAAGYSEWNITGGTITGVGSGIAIKSGKLNISGTPIISCTGPNEAPTEGWSNGVNASGAALQIESNSGYAGDIEINISGGTISSTNGYSIYEYIGNGTDTNVKSLSIANGNFTGSFCISEELGNSNPRVFTISGGTFSSDPTAYVANGYIAKKNSETEYAVIEKTNLTDGVYMSDPTGATAANYYVSGEGPWTVYYVAPYIPPVTPPTTTETVTNDDGSTTTTVTDKSTGTVTETTTSEPVTDEAGNTTQTTTETVTNKDGSTVETVTETVKGADGSATETKTETVTDAEGVTTSTETVKATDTTGSTGTTTTTTNADGETTVTAEATVSAEAAAAAAETGAAVTVPVEVPAAASTETAAEVSISVPASAGSVAVEVPVTDVNPGVVAIVVNADGTEEIIKTSVPTENGVVLNVEGDATVKIVDNSKDFDDVEKTDWHDNAVTFVAAREIMNGTGGDNFSPNADLNRGMIVKVLHNLENNPESSAENIFDDVSDDTWYTDAVRWAAENSIVEGYGSSYSPDDSITREQLATILYRYASLKGYDMTKTGDMTAFHDSGEISDWAQTAMEWAVGVGLLSGKGNGTLDPTGTASRAEVAQMFMNFCTNVVK